MLGELARGADVGFLSPFRHASELKSLDHSLLQVGHSYTSKLDLSFGKGSVVDRTPIENDRAITVFR